MSTLPLLTGYAQTRSSWARALDTFDQIPDAYQDVFQTLPELATGQCPYLVLIPSYAGFLNQAEDKLIACFDRQLYVLERNRRQLKCTGYSHRDVSYVEMGSVLLRSWMTIRGINSEGVASAVTFTFNAVREQLFAPILEKLRPTPSPLSGADLDAERAKFDGLVQENFKFATYARLSIRPGDQVIQAVLQPKLSVRVFSVLGWTLSRTICHAHISILTDTELVTIRDEARPGHSKYGSVWRYIPLDKITAVSLASQEGDLLALSIHLPENEQINHLFSVSKRRRIEDLRNQLEALVSVNPRPR